MVRGADRALGREEGGTGRGTNQLEGLPLAWTGTGSSFQIWEAYSRIERSLLK